MITCTWVQRLDLANREAVFVEWMDGWKDGLKTF